MLVKAARNQLSARDIARMRGPKRKVLRSHERSGPENTVRSCCVGSNPTN